MKNPNKDDLAIGIPVNAVSYAAEEFPGEPASVSERSSPFPQSSVHASSNTKQRHLGSVIDWLSKLSKKADSYAQGIRGHVSLGPKISQTVKGKFSVGARILQAGGVQRVFRQLFCVGQGEKLLKASQCYLSTTAGPIAGLLFISTEKIAFYSDRSITLTSHRGELSRVPYKVLIPVGSIKQAIPSENADKPNQKYIQIVTIDDFEFWFMGFVSYSKSFKYLRRAILETQVNFLQNGE